jgi:adenine-specific DNA glycosylase
MQLGQLVCLPRSPRCDTCPVERFCEAHRTDETSLYPPRRQRRTIERRRLRVRLLHDRCGRVLLSRGEFPFLPHLWLPPILIQPSDKVVPGRSPRAKALAPKAPVTKAPITFRHAIQHREFEVEVRAKLLPAAELRRRARITSRTQSTVERRVFAPETLATVGRSALLTKSLRHLPALARNGSAQRRS